MSVVGLCLECGDEVAAHECDPGRVALLDLLEHVIGMALDDYLDDDDRGLSTEDDGRIPPPEEGEPA